MGEIKNKHAKKIAENVKKHTKERNKCIANSDGGIYFEIFVPNINKDQYEKWQLGVPHEGGYTFYCSDSNEATKTVFLNHLTGFKNKYCEDNPKAILGDILSQMKHNLVIDEEELEDYEH